MSVATINQPLPKKKRIFYFDALRASAILLVVLIHLSKWFAKVETVGSSFWTFSTFLGVLCMVGVPIFLMISGALLLNRDYELPSFLKRRFSRILYPFFFWIFIIIIFKIVFRHHSTELFSVINMFFQGGFIWFVWMLIGVYLFIPVVNSFVKEFKLKGVEYFLVIWLITILLNTFGLYPFKKLELSYFAGYLGYLLLGYYLANKKFNLSDKKLAIIGVLLFVIFSLVNMYFKNNPLIGTFYLDTYYLSIIIVLQAVGMFLAYKYFANYSENNDTTLSNKVYSYIKDSWIGKILLSISVCSYGIFLTHYLPIWVVMWIDEAIPIFARNPFKWIPFLFVIIVLLSWGLIWVFSKIPYLKIVSGAN